SNRHAGRQCQQRQSIQQPRLIATWASHSSAMTCRSSVSTLSRHRRYQADLHSQWSQLSLRLSCIVAADNIFEIQNTSSVLYVSVESHNEEKYRAYYEAVLRELYSTSNATLNPKNLSLDQQTREIDTPLSLTINAHSSFVTSSLIAGLFSVSIECRVI